MDDFSALSISLQNTYSDYDNERIFMSALYAEAQNFEPLSVHVLKQ